MQRKTRGVLLALAGALDVSIASAEESAQVTLNKALALKPAVQRQREITVMRQVCREYRIPSIANGGTGMRCHNVPSKSLETFSDVARVTSTSLVQAKDIKLDQSKITSLPSQPLMHRAVYKNCADGTTISHGITLSVQGTKGFSVTKTRSTTITNGGSVQMTGSFTYGGGTAGMSTTYNFSRAVTASTAVQESESVSETRTQTWTVNVPSQKMGFVEMLAYQSTIDIPFSAVLIVDGPLEANLSGANKASDILPETERTIEFSGTLRLTNVSESTFRTDNLPGNAKCESEEAGDLIVEGKQRALAPSTTPMQGFQSSAEFSKQSASLTTVMPTAGKIGVQAMQSNGDKSTAPKDGISYETLNRFDVIQASPQCGYTPVGDQKLATLQAEERRYSNYVNGIRIGEWDDTYFKFKACTAY